MRRTVLTVGLLGVLLIASQAPSGADESVPAGAGADLQNVEFKNPTGVSASFSPTGSIPETGTFFQSLGTNGRTCVTCHQPGDGWSLSARTAQALFDQTNGTHPLFAFDGQNCPGGELSTNAARRRASSLMLDKGLVRFIRPLSILPPEFDLVAWEGTYCNPVDASTIVFYRRSLPVTNFDTLSAVGWDGGAGLLLGIQQALGFITSGATQVHEQTTFTMSLAQVSEVIGFMGSLLTAQVNDADAKDLTANGALGGPQNLANLPMTGAPGFTIYDTWRDLPGQGTQSARRAVARGQTLFNARCAGCHSSPNRGNSATGALINLGLADAAHRTPDLPLYTLRNGTTGETTQVSDLGLAGVTGRWTDLGKFKVPNLRGVATRAPYFHNGYAATLADVVDFYDARFHMNLSAADKSDLVSFLRAL